jgi:vancomycin resistance protein YoaR
MPVVDVPPIEAATPGPSEPKVYEAPTGAAGTTSPATPAPPLGGAYRPAPGPSEAETTEAAATTEPGAAEPEPEGERPRHMRVGRAGGAASTETEAATAPSADRRRVLAMVAPAVVLVLLLAAWAIDTATHSGQVLRNVELAGRSIDGVKEEDLPKVVSGIADDMAARTVTIKSGNKTYQATAGELGLAVDQQATVDAALDVGRGDSLLVRPFKWLGAFFSSRSAPVEFSMSKSTTAATLQRLQGADQTQPVEPQIQLAATGFTLVAGKPGVGIDVDELSQELKKAAQAEPTGEIKLTAESKEVDPTFSDEQAQGLADRANELTANGLKLNADGHTADVPAQTLRGWLSQTVTDGKLDLAFNADAAKAALPGLLGGVSAEPKNATVILTNGVPTVVPGQNGVTCCGDEAGNQIWQALKDKKPDVALEAAVKEPEFTTDEVTAWGIKQPIGGNRGYKSGAEVNGGVGPGFTTYHGAGEPRNINIERIADEVRGAVIPPGGDFSINEYVGQRTYADGYVDAGAIRNSQHVSEVGGGISQFATTTFNAAYFAGLDITESQSHSEWFSRYPPGREATMGFPHPDVKIHNNTPYGVMIWTSYTPTSLTVTMYSTPYATAEQTGSQESMSGVCRVVVTTRTRTYPDGKPQQQDQFKSTYRPEGRLCSGAAVPPAPPH